MSIIFVKLPIL